MKKPQPIWSAKPNGRAANRLALLRSLHFIRPIEGPRGPISVLFEDEAEWALKFHELRVASPGAASPLDITGAARMPQIEVIRVPCWEVTLRHAEERAIQFTVPLENVTTRAPIERVGAGEGAQWVPAQMAAARRTDLARIGAVRAEGNAGDDADVSAEAERIERGAASEPS